MRYFKNITIALTVVFATLMQAQQLPTVTNNAFGKGEKLTFDVKYGFVTAGVAIMEIPQIRKTAGRDSYVVNFQVNSVPSFDMVYKVRTRYESYIDVAGLFSWRFEQHIRESKFTNDYSAFFDQRKNKARTPKGSFDVPPGIHDIVSAFYYTRILDFGKMKKGESFWLKNFHDDKVNDLQVIYRGKEKVKVTAGTFNCIIVEPVVKAGGLFKSDGTILVYLTDDVNRMPVLVKSKIVIGAIEAELTKYEGIKNPLTSKVK